MRRLDAADNDSLLALARTRTTGSAEFHVERAPDFFALSRRLGDTAVYGAFQGEALAASLSVSKQERFIDGVETLTTYLHDLRSRPDHEGLAFVLLVREVLRAERPLAPWAFATVLAANPIAPGLVAAAARLLGGGRAIGTVDHVALSPASTSPALKVVEVDVATGAGLYLRWAPRRCLAPADPRGWSLLSGRWLVAVRGGEPVAVTLAAREADRRIIATETRRELDVGYLSFACASDPADDEEAESAFVRHLANAAWAGWGLLFRGRARPLPPRGQVLLSSTTYAFGAVPESLTVGLPELTLI